MGIKSQFARFFQNNTTILNILRDAVYVQFVLLCVIHMVSLSTLPPVFNQTPTNVTCHMGQTAILRCSISNLGSREVIWKSVKSPHALTIGEFVFVKDPSYSIKHIPYKDEWNLVIENVKPKHAGIYECQISTKEDLIRNVQLNVDNEPLHDNKNIVITGPLYVEKGHPIRLSCNVTGTVRAPEDIDWFQKGVKLKNDALKGVYIKKYRRQDTLTLTSQLKITYSDVNDSGTYICRSSNRSKIKITTHYLAVLNSESSQIKRGTVPELVNIVHKDAHASDTGTGSRIEALFCTTMLVMISSIVVM